MIARVLRRSTVYARQSWLSQKSRLAQSYQHTSWCGQEVASFEQDWAESDGAMMDLCTLSTSIHLQIGRILLPVFTLTYLN
jgi:hypothetical protein